MKTDTDEFEDEYGDSIKVSRNVPDDGLIWFNTIGSPWLTYDQGIALGKQIIESCMKGKKGNEVDNGELQNKVGE